MFSLVYWIVGQIVQYYDSGKYNYELRYGHYRYDTLLRLAMYSTTWWKLQMGHGLFCKRSYNVLHLY